MPARAGIKVTKVTTRSRAPTKAKGGRKGAKKCPVCGKYMGSGQRG